MSRFRIPKSPALKKDYSKCPWTDQIKIANPTTFVRELQNQGVETDKLLDTMFVDMHYDRQKSDMLCRAVKEQGHIVRNDNEAILTINIPFCAWRCFNCQRVMYQATKSDDILPYYYEALQKEVELARDIIKKNCYIVKSVCYTGNLLSLDLEKIETLLKISAYSLSETCVEIGNPAFVSKEKLELLKKYNVSRILLRPLTFNMATLRKLCRRFDFKDFYSAYRLIAGFGFDTNIELAVGLIGEHELQVKRNIQMAIDLGATNIDLFSRNCKYNPEELTLVDKDKIIELRKMLEFTYNFMIKNKYQPYFVYNCEVENGCFENVGYTIPNKKCIYVADRVEQISTTIGCGTDAESIRVRNLHNEKTFQKNPYDIGQYMLGIEEYMEKKKKFFA